MRKIYEKKDKMKQTVLITGASSGIGLEFARIFAREGFDLILAARNKAKLTQIANELTEKFNISCHLIPIDLGTNGAGAMLYRELTRKRLSVDILVNNAGIGDGGEFVKTDIHKMLSMLHLNVVTLTHLIRLIGADMVKRGSGRILNVASVAGFFPGPLMAVYYATKAYVVSFSYSLHEELKGTGVSVTALCPGPTATGFQKAAGMAESWLFRRQMMSAERVAQVGFAGLMKGKRLVVPGSVHGLQVFLSRFAPFAITAPVIKRMHQK